MSHANVLVSSSPSDACLHMRKEIFALHCSLLFSVPRRLHSDPEDVCSVLGTVVECYFLALVGEQLPGLVLLPLARRHSCPAALHVFLLVDDQFESRAL